MENYYTLTIYDRKKKIILIKYFLVAFVFTNYKSVLKSKLYFNWANNKENKKNKENYVWQALNRKVSKLSLAVFFWTIKIIEVYKSIQKNFNKLSYA